MSPAQEISPEAGPLAYAESSPQRAARNYKVAVRDMDADVEGLWRDFEARSVGTPYQRLDWIEAYDRGGENQGSRRVVVTVNGADGKLLALLPLDIAARAGLAVAAIPGGKHANFKMPLVAPGAALDAPAWRDILRLAGRQASIDLFHFRLQPRVWHGHVNGLAGLGAEPSASSGYELLIDFPAAETRARLISAKRRRAFKQKERKLAELGPLSFRHMTSEADVRRTLSAFLTQKGQRFADRSIANPFTDPAVQEFLHAACLPEAGREPAVRLYALLLGDDVIATRAAVVGGRRMSVMFDSFSQDPDIARCSPADLSLLELVETAAGEGITHFDLGVGDQAYKLTYCKDVMALVDGIVPVTARGMAAAVPLRLITRARRRIKRSAALSALVRRVRLVG